MHSYDLADAPSLTDFTDLSPGGSVATSLTSDKRYKSTGNIQTSQKQSEILKTSSDSRFPGHYTHCSCLRQVFKTCPLVYVSYASGSRRHEKEVVDLCHVCDKAGFAVKCDSYRALQEAGELNILQWRDVNFRRAACVLFCISPAYIDIIRSVEDSPIASAAESDHDKGVIYLYRQAQSELVNKCSMNRRFFSVLFSNSGSNLDVPQCFSPYTKFKFPEDSKVLIKAMQNSFNRTKIRSMD